MVWKNLRLFSINSDKLNPDSIMKNLEDFKFNGEEGINKFEVWRDSVVVNETYKRLQNFTVRSDTVEILYVE